MNLDEIFSKIKNEFDSSNKNINVYNLFELY